MTNSTASLPVIEFGPAICADPAQALRREWLATNGLGGYACGTVGGARARSYHGLLVAAVQPPAGRELLLAALDETLQYAGQEYSLACHEWSDGRLSPNGLVFLASFRLSGSIAVWRYTCADALLEKAVWMEPGANLTYIEYTLLQAGGPVDIKIAALATRRDHHAVSHAGLKPEFQAVPAGGGVHVGESEAGQPFLTLTADRGDWQPDSGWVCGFFLRTEAERGQACVEDLWRAGRLRVRLRPGESVTIAAAAGAAAPLTTGARQRRAACDAALLAAPQLAAAPPWIRQLALAADQFIVRRSLPGQEEGYTIIAGYPWFADWGRDAMISLPGLTLAVGRLQIARSILKVYAAYLDQGMLPNRFPDRGDAPEYNTADATLWYFQAARAYLDASGDDPLLEELFPALQEIMDWHVHGTRYGIRADPADGLLFTGEPGVQLTWMDVKVDGWVVTPRTGKPVEINALWCNALDCMAEFSRRLGRPDALYREMAERGRRNFQRFWNPAAAYCYDVLDSPDGDDPTLRPNQLLAVSLPVDLLTPEQSRQVVAACGRSLYAAAGLRSLSPADPRYTGRYLGGRYQRDAGYHQGSSWGWLLGPYLSALLKTGAPSAEVRRLLEPVRLALSDGGLGTLAEIYDGDPPHTPRGCFAQAWSVAVILRLWQELEAADVNLSNP